MEDRERQIGGWKREWRRVTEKGLKIVCGEGGWINGKETDGDEEQTRKAEFKNIYNIKK